MFNFFKKARFTFKFTKFTFKLLFFASFANAAININTSDNVEIADFIKRESNEILQVPDTIVLDLNFKTAHNKHSRAGVLFFFGEREVSIEADYTLHLPAGPLKSTLKADTSWFTGYCGIIECQSKPISANQRIEVLKILVSKLLTEFNGRLRMIFSERKANASVPPPEPAPAPAVLDSAPVEKEIEEKQED